MSIKQYLSKFYFITVSFCLCLNVQALSDSWWQGSSPENILTNAQLNTLDLSYFHGRKAQLLSDKNTSIECFQRRTVNGNVEKSLVTKSLVNYARGLLPSGSPAFLTSVDYSLESGNYFYFNNQLIKSEFETYDELKQKVASKFDHPYEYQMLAPALVGTNECLVIACTMIKAMAGAIGDARFNGLTSEQKVIVSRKMLDQSIKSELDYYIRKSDGTIMGFLEKNSSGELLDDDLYDVVQINVPIPDKEFTLPNDPVIIARSWHEWSQMDDDLVTKAMADVRIKNAPAIQLRRHIILTVLVISAFAFPLVLWIKFWRRTSNLSGRK